MRFGLQTPGVCVCVAEQVRVSEDDSNRSRQTATFRVWLCIMCRYCSKHRSSQASCV